MKKLSLLLCLLLCVGVAAAEDVLTEGVFDYSIQDYAWMDTKSVLITGYHLEEGVTEVFYPVELGGYPVSAVNMHGLPESVTTVYAPRSYAGIVPPEGREFIEVIYLDYTQAQESDSYAPLLPDMAEGDYALTEIMRIRRGEDNLQTQSVVTKAEIKEMTFLQEANGHKLHDAVLRSNNVQNGCTIVSRPGGVAELVEFHLAEGQTVVYVPENWNGLTVQVKGETIPEQVTTVYKSWGSGIIEPAEGRELVEAFYVTDQEAWRYYSDSVSDIKDGDLVLMEVGKYTTENGQCIRDVGYLVEDELPETLDGHRLNTTAVETAICKVAGDCVYYISPYNGSATIVDARLPEGATELVVPKELGQYFCYILPEVLDKGIYTIYMPWGCYGRIYSTREDSSCCWMYYADYDMVMADAVLSQQLTDMGEDEYALIDARLHRMKNENGYEVDLERFIHVAAEGLPTELRGHKLNTKLLMHDGVVDTFSYDSLLRGDVGEVELYPNMKTSDYWNLTLYESGLGYVIRPGNEGQMVIDIKSCSVPEGSKTLVIPPELGGISTKGASLQLEIIPESVETIYAMGDYGSWNIWNSEPSTRKLTLINYTDWAGAEEIQGGRPAEMQENDLMWVSATNQDYATGTWGKWPESVVADCELPTEIDGRRVHLPSVSMDFARTSGNWAYLVEEVDEQKEVHIVKYLGEDEPAYLVVPEELDGIKVTQFIYSAVPESVKMVITQNDCGILDYGEHTGELLRVTFDKNFTEKTVLLEYVSKVSFTQGQYSGMTAWVLVEDLPEEIDGKKVQVPQNEYFRYTSSEWTYYLGPYGVGGKTIAWITGSTLEEGITELALPKELDGYKVNYIDTAAIPQSVKTITVPEGIHVRTDIGGSRPDLEIVQEKE